MSPRTTGILVLVAAALGAFVYFYEVQGRASRTEAEEPAFRTTVNQLNQVFALPGTQVSVNSFRILGGAPEQSAIFARVNSRASGQQMPPFASKVVDQEAATLETDAAGGGLRGAFRGSGRAGEACAHKGSWGPRSGGHDFRSTARRGSCHAATIVVMVRKPVSRT